MLLIVGFMSRRDEVEGLINNKLGVDPESATNAALGFIIGIFAFGIVGTFSQGLQGMMRSGQLEQLCLSPYGLVTNFMARTMVGAVTSVLSSSLMLYFVSITVKGRLYADPVPTVILLILTYFNLIGFGFMVGGLVLLFKQTGQVAMLVRFALLGLAVWASDTIDTGYRALDWLVHALPITDAAICLKHVLINNQMIDGEKVSVFSMQDFPSFPLLLINCVAWTFIGISVFKAMENWSRDKGTLGAY
jgi:ABC-type polysaccharide/polyol phosphate export permease